MSNDKCKHAAIMMHPFQCIFCELERVQAERDQLKAECERLRHNHEVDVAHAQHCHDEIDSLRKQLAAMTAARNALADLLDNAPDPGCSPAFWAKLRAVGGKETT